MIKSFISAAVVLSVLVPSIALASVDISLDGGTVQVEQGHTYSEPGYTANSTVDGDITSSVAVDNPGTGRLGTFTVGYSVTDSALDTATVFRTLVVYSTGGSMPYCSGPMAPGWQTGLADGGCSRAAITLNPGQTVDGFTCPEFLLSGCRLPR